ncbi:DUF4974 domain-containing protein [Chitinophaga sedimenti]|uniref:FecR family protein n=1 Tax=Chitinophaga sedimenti TaxID=2033606 RepID=UPI002005B134|nr:FecR family protein [Chitinophaga sedimenti]MCK7555735.1 DUF4974 domain-containing protein [Chitinophaga sedimenti]
MTGNRLEYLYAAYMNNDKLSAAEKQELWSLLTDPALEPQVKALMDERFGHIAPHTLQSEAAADAMFSDITALPREEAIIRPMRNNRRWWAAAAVVLGVGAGFYLLRQPVQHNTIGIVQNDTISDAEPGREGAILTLANGRQVVLDSLGNAVVAVQNGTQLVVKNGQLEYNAGATGGGEIQFNTITTPKGRQYRVVLPDGSKAWLNAASSLRYPVTFHGNERRVEVTGEVYFEIQDQAEHPFFVQVVSGPEIRVLGTNFNVNAYADESVIHTTLLSGKVQVADAVLRPGQEARLHRQSGRIEVKEADAEAVMAWKNGNFYFAGADIRTIMRQLARWYDVEVEYTNVPVKKFSGTIPRNVNVSQVFKILEATGNVRFTIEGNQITVDR